MDELYILAGKLVEGISKGGDVGNQVTELLLELVEVGRSNGVSGSTLFSKMDTKQRYPAVNSLYIYLGKLAEDPTTPETYSELFTAVTNIHNIRKSIVDNRP